VIRRKNIAKILITGPFNAGKTTLIRYVTTEQLLSRDVETTDNLAQFKSLTTVGLDFGILKVDDSLHVHLFGTPGQARFNFMWEVLSRGALGTIILIDTSNSVSISEGREMYRYYCAHQYFNREDDSPIIIGATKRDVDGAISIDELANELNAEEHMIIPCDPRNKEDSKMLVMALMQQVIDNNSNVEDAEFGEDDDEDDFF